MLGRLRGVVKGSFAATVFARSRRRCAARFLSRRGKNLRAKVHWWYKEGN